MNILNLFDLVQLLCDHICFETVCNCHEHLIMRYRPDKLDNVLWLATEITRQPQFQGGNNEKWSKMR